MTNCTVLEQAHSRQIPVSPCRNLFGQDQVCGNNLKGLGGVTSLVKRAERRWGYNEVARQHLLLVRMCLKALPCFHAPSFSNALCDYSWSHSDAIKKAVRICAGVQSTKATRPDIFKTHRYGVDLYRGPLIKIFVFIPHRTAELRWSFSQPILLHPCTGLAIAASFSCCGGRVRSDIFQCGCCQQTWMMLLCPRTCYTTEKAHVGARS